MRDNGERILDMLEAIDRIERHSVKGREAFLEDELIQSLFLTLENFPIGRLGSDQAL